MAMRAGSNPVNLRSNRSSRVVKGAYCSDPYGLRCRQSAVGSMIGTRWDWSKDEEIAVTIYVCSSCAYWNCDWDWDESPKGPSLPAIWSSPVA